MKNVISKYAQLVAVTLMIAAPASVLAQDQLPATKEVAVSVSDVYVPGGFDSDADAFVVANGMFPNGCYRWKGADVTNIDALNHEIRSTATVSQGMCIMVLVPFTKEIRLGKLSSGNHTLRFLNGDGTYLEKTLSVE